MAGHQWLDLDVDDDDDGIDEEVEDIADTP
jgi:hypothetical protein